MLFGFVLPCRAQTTDDNNCSETAASPSSPISWTAQTNPPTVSFTSPSAGAVVSGRTSLTVSAVSAVAPSGANSTGISNGTLPGPTRVEFFLDGGFLGSAAQPPFSFLWSSSAAFAGAHALAARVYDATMNYSSSTINIFVSNGGSSSLPPPTGLILSGTDFRQIISSWTAVQGAAGYQIQVSTLSDFSFPLLGYDNRNVGNVTSFDITGLYPSQTFYMRVRAYNFNFQQLISSYSATASAMTAAFTSSSRLSFWARIPDPAVSTLLADAVTGIQLAVSSGALTQPQTFSAESADLPPAPGSLIPAGTVYKLGPEGLPLGPGVTLTLPYTGAAAPAIYSFNPQAGGWQVLAGSKADPAHQTVSAPLAHFSFYGPFVAPQAGAQGLEILDLYAYPSPARGVNPTIHVSVGAAAQEVDVKFFNMAGELVGRLNITMSVVVGGQWIFEAPWNVAGIPSGVYLFTVQAVLNGQSSSRKTKRLALIK